jgi:hypothetical protein
MEQVKCINNKCVGTLMEDDGFCGLCGTAAAAVRKPAPRPDPAREDGDAHNGERPAWTAQADEDVPLSGQAPFFEHEPSRRPAALSNATRYLCAAAYLDRGFANDVIRQLLASRRAVAPSANFDVGPVIRHCLRARKNILFRDIALVAVMVIALFISPLSTVDFLFFAIILGALLPNLRWKSRGLTGKVLYTAGILVGVSLLSTVISLVNSFLIGAASSGPKAVVITFLALFVVTGGVQHAYVRAMFRTLIEHLQLGAAPPGPASGEAEARIDMVEGAQWGNVTLYRGEDPFIGAGWILEEDWSIAIKLEPKEEGRKGFQALAHASDEYVAIDPVDLHKTIAERLRRLNDPGLPVNERISALTVSDRVVGSGFLYRNSPLIDKDLSTPYSHASWQAVEALIRHPQAGLRYYQQVSVNDEGPPVTSDGQLVIEGADQGVVVSAFVYAAVEGRMFYLQFVLTALPPISSDYRDIDLLPGKSNPAFQVKMLGYSLRTFCAAAAYSPAGIVSAYRLHRREQRWKKKALSSNGSAVADLGARMSVRERGTYPKFDSYIEDLDVRKYKSIIQRLLLETAQDYLAAKGVDTSAFEGAAVNILNGDFMKNVSVTGNNNRIGSGGNRRFSRASSRPA